MSSAAPVDVLTLPIDHVEVNAGEYLSDLSPRQKPWDQHRGETDDVTAVFASSPFARHRRYAERMSQCAQYIGFARDPPKNGKIQLKLTNARFCRVRFCIICQWRRSLMWQARLHRALPHLVADYPQARFLFATFTLRNCDVHLLRLTLKQMAQAWKRLTEVKVFPAIGWIRSMEVTHGRDGKAHPHFHTLLMVQPEYFTTGYLHQPQWVELWRQCLRIDYSPVVDVQAVNPQRNAEQRSTTMTSHALWNTATEVIKYTVKVSDMLRDDRWFLAVSDEVWKIRAVAVGGILKQYLKDRKKENLFDEPGIAPSEEEVRRIYFQWKQLVRKYQKLG